MRFGLGLVWGGYQKQDTGVWNIGALIFFLLLFSKSISSLFSATILQALKLFRPSRQFTVLALDRRFGLIVSYRRRSDCTVECGLGEAEHTHGIGRFARIDLVTAWCWGTLHWRISRIATSPLSSYHRFPLGCTSRVYAYEFNCPNFDCSVLIIGIIAILGTYDFRRPMPIPRRNQTCLSIPIPTTHTLDLPNLSV